MRDLLASNTWLVGGVKNPFLSQPVACISLFPFLLSRSALPFVKGLPFLVIVVLLWLESLERSILGVEYARSRPCGLSFSML
jgi:hypothetical protein